MTWVDSDWLRKMEEVFKNIHFPPTDYKQGWTAARRRLWAPVYHEFFKTQICDSLVIWNYFSDPYTNPVVGLHRDGYKSTCSLFSLFTSQSRAVTPNCNWSSN